MKKILINTSTFNKNNLQTDYFINNIQVFPNPTAGKLVIKGLPLNCNLSINIYDSMGKLVFEKTYFNISTTKILPNLKIPPKKK